MSAEDFSLSPPADQLATATSVCISALAEPKFSALSCLDGAPANAEGWFDLLAGYPDDAACVSAIKRLVSQAPREAVEADATVEHYAVLQTLTVAAARIGTLPLPASVKLLFATMCRDIARPTGVWRKHFHEDLIDQPRKVFSEPGKLFRDLARLATLRRFPAGDYVFDYYPGIPRSWLLKMQPRHLPGFLYKLLVECGGWGPHAAPHIHSGRSNQLFLREAEFHKSLWRIARTLEMRPDVKAVATNAWLTSAETAERFPNLRWFRSTFQDGGAYLIDMEPAAPDAGFMMGSAKRRQLHESSAFFPRETLVLWPRQDVLAWAARRPELADPGETPIQAPRAQPKRFRLASPSPSPATKHNSRIHLWSGLDMLANRPKRYIKLAILLPAFVAALVASGADGWVAGGPAFVAAFVAAWLFQYYAFQ